MPKVNIFFVGVVSAGIDAAEETAGSDDPAEKAVNILVLAAALSESRAFGIGSTAPAAEVVELIKLLGFESEEPNLNTADSPPDEEKVNGTCVTLSTFLLKPELTKGVPTPGSFGDAAFSKCGLDLAESFDGASAAVSSVDGTTLFPKLNKGGLATDPFGVVDLLKPKFVFEAAAIAPAVGLKIGSEADEVIEIGTSTFSSTLDPSAVLT